MSSVASYKSIASRQHTLILVGVVLGLLLIGSCTCAWGQTTDSNANDWLPAPTPTDSVATATQPGTARSGSDLMPVSITDLLAKLALVALLVYGATWGLKQWRERAIATPSSGRGGLIRVRESIALGNAGHLYVIEFGSRNLLVSAVGDQVTLLTGNSSSEMNAFDTSSIPVQDPQIEEPETAEPEVDGGTFQRKMRDVNGARLRAENFRKTADWERKRDALVRALQESARSQAS